MSIVPSVSVKNYKNYALAVLKVSCFGYFWPRVGSGIVRIDTLRFLAGCPKKRLNQV